MSDTLESIDSHFVPISTRKKIDKKEDNILKVFVIHFMVKNSWISPLGCEHLTQDLFI